MKPDLTDQEKMERELENLINPPTLKDAYFDLISKRIKLNFKRESFFSQITKGK